MEPIAFDSPGRPGAAADGPAETAEPVGPVEPTSSDSPTGPAELSELNRITKEIDDVYRKAARVLQLSDCAFWILYALRETGETLTQRDICAMFFQPKQTVNSALKKLEADGYLSLCHTVNLKSKAVQLTARGQALITQTIDRVREREQLALQGLTPAERQTFLHLSRKFGAQLKAHMQSLDGYPTD